MADVPANTLARTPTPPEDWIALLAPYVTESISIELIAKLDIYLGLLLQWNARTNLTAVRDARQIIPRHFGESLFLARHVPRGTLSLLDHGSGAGFPGIPVALTLPEIRVTLAESHGKKVGFLREVVRRLELQNSEVYPGRTEDLVRQFPVVAMRAVDGGATAYAAALKRLTPGGTLMALEGAEPVLDRACVSEAIPNSVGFLRIYTVD